MGFFDKATSIANNVIEGMDEQLKKRVKNMSDSELKKLLQEHPDNKYVREEARRRGI